MRKSCIWEDGLEGNRSVLVKARAEDLAINRVHECGACHEVEEQEKDEDNEASFGQSSPVFSEGEEKIGVTILAVKEAGGHIVAINKGGKAMVF